MNPVPLLGALHPATRSVQRDRVVAIGIVRSDGRQVTKALVRETRALRTDGYGLSQSRRKFPDCFNGRVEHIPHTSEPA
jgi:hypothetical protein